MIENGTVPEHRCAFCQSTELTEVINFGEVALAGGFLRPDQIADEQTYPLVIVFCTNCYVVQVRDHIDPAVLFKTDFYFSSAIKTLRDHFADYAAEVTGRFLSKPEESVVIEFGSNDGVLLQPLAAQNIGTVIGVDPATNIINTIADERLVLVNDFFNVPTATTIAEKHGKADLIMANNVFAHITDINGTTEAVNAALSDDGVFVFEVHYLGKIIEDLQYDFIYHEHIYYYSLLALENHFARHDMVIFDLKPIAIHGGSIRYYAAKKGSSHAKTVSTSVTALHAREVELGYDKPETYMAFTQRVEQKKQQLMKLLEALRSKGRTVAGYGASGRANTIIQYCGITDEHVDFMIDDGPAKHGLFTPGSHLEIRSNDALKAEKPDYIVLFAWSFYQEIVAKCQGYLESGGRIIVPLPEVRITLAPTDESIL